MTRISSTALITVAVLLSGVGAFAQQGATVRVRAQIVSVQGGEVAVKTREGREERLVLKDPVIQVSLASSLEEIKADDFIGTAAKQQPDGSWRALEVHIFPPGSRTNEGVNEWDLVPGSSMTNAVVSAMESKVGGVEGRELVLSYKGSQRRVLVGPTTPVVKTRPGELSDLKPGERIFVAGAERLPDGRLQASRVTVGANGVSPPQ